MGRTGPTGLAAGEVSRPPFELIAGAAASPVILHVPHSARALPAAVRRSIVLDDVALGLELDHITDAHTAEIAAEAAASVPLTPWQFVNRLSRLVVDPERFPDEREEMRAVGMGAVYTHTTHRERLRAPETDEQPLIEAYFHPYAAAITRAVDERLASAGRAVVIDVHSYPTEPLPYELHGDGPRPPVCLGTDPFHTPDGLLARAREAFAPLGVTAVNTPFAGTYVPLKHYGKDRRVSALMIEIRRDLYMSEPGGQPGPGLKALAEAVAALVHGESAK
ncbi:N-formylglutamate amidohydrolase [Streptomyces beijiangensis]|uniref:N-formylglutamate amidohydrolase n=1 Tax=Streptomyces beijiangensis TaxID=163361 RepID=A0A939F1G6_9ACTN|nr:N-formylglutamate amidohydrolase [Streptomyces beijiangensis]MBO0510397.1 N-formylglutamate amidohydrolase [Streptomyces beijiangensis]